MIEPKKLQIGIIAGNRQLPVTLIKAIKNQHPDSCVTAICFKGETSSMIGKLADKAFWVNSGHLRELTHIIKVQNFREWVMAGQINPMRIFSRSSWDEDLRKLVDSSPDFRPHNIFAKIIESLEKHSAKFVDSTVFLKNYLAGEGVMNLVPLDNVKEDINFGLKIISRYTELDVGQTIVVKDKTAVALESLEGTDKTILRGYKLAGAGCTVVKFCKLNQDLRFDVAVVGLATLNVLKKIKAASLVLEKDKVIILDKDKFLSLAKKLNIAVVGKTRLDS